MKHLKTYESFNLKFIFNWAVTNINKYYDAKVASEINKGIEIAKNNSSDPEMQELVSKIDNLSEEDKNKLRKLTQNSNLIDDTLFAGSTFEGVKFNFDVIKKKLMKISGYGAIFGTISHLLYRIISTKFINVAIDTESFGTSNTFSVILVMIGVTIGAYLLASAENEDAVQ